MVAVVAIAAVVSRAAAPRVFNALAVVVAVAEAVPCAVLSVDSITFCSYLVAVVVIARRFGLAFLSLVQIAVPATARAGIWA